VVNSHQAPSFSKRGGVYGEPKRKKGRKYNWRLSRPLDQTRKISTSSISTRPLGDVAGGGRSGVLIRVNRLSKFAGTKQDDKKYALAQKGGEVLTEKFGRENKTDQKRERTGGLTGSRLVTREQAVQTVTRHIKY